MERTQPGKRIYGIDALRAIAMLLGIVLHATIAYKTVPLNNWPVDNLNTQLFFDVVYEWIHSFRMPLFYMIAGYFCRMLLLRSSVKEFIAKRWKRIGVPFIISVFTILPFTIFPFIVDLYSQQNNNWNEVFRLSFKQLIGWNGLAHLWFLYYLILYYGFVLAFWLFAKDFTGKLVGRFSRFAKGGGFWIYGLFFTVLVWVVLLDENELYIQVDTGVFPPIRFLLYYLLFFLMGYWTHRFQDFLIWMRKNAIFLLGISHLLFAYFIGYGYWHEFQVLGPWQKTSVKLLAALQITFLVWGLTGLFLKLYKSESRLWRYISDASYWMYLIHMGLIAGFQIWFEHSTIPGYLRFPLVLILTLFICLVTYQLFVRYSIIGTYLHGERLRKKT